jgi:ribokinase
MGLLSVVGSYVRDHVWVLARMPAVGETLAAERNVSGHGGKGFNQATAACKLGATVRFIAAIGEDEAGRAVQADARALGIDGVWFARPALATAAAGIFVDAHGANQIAVSLSANLSLSAEDVHAALRAGNPSDVVLTQLETSLAATRAALEHARREGALALLNPAPLHASVDADLLTLADVITPNETEFAQAHVQLGFGALDPTTLHAADDATLHAHCRRLGTPTVVMTLGARGVFVSHAPSDRRGDSIEYYRVNAETVTAIDTTGAGDAFSGALAAHLANTQDVPFIVAVRFANRVAALSTERLGAAAAMPSREEVAARWA